MEILTKEQKDLLADFLESIRDYERESHNLIGFDERETSEFVEIYEGILCDRNHDSDTESGLHKHFVKRSTSAFMLIAKTQPKVINAQIPVYWKKYVAEQDADLFGGKVVKCDITW